MTLSTLLPLIVISLGAVLLIAAAVSALLQRRRPKLLVPPEASVRPTDAELVDLEQISRSELRKVRRQVKRDDLRQQKVDDTVYAPEGKAGVDSATAPTTDSVDETPAPTFLDAPLSSEADKTTIGDDGVPADVDAWLAAASRDTEVRDNWGSADLDDMPSWDAPVAASQVTPEAPPLDVPVPLLVPSITPAVVPVPTEALAPVEPAIEYPAQWSAPEAPVPVPSQREARRAAKRDAKAAKARAKQEAKDAKARAKQEAKDAKARAKQDAKDAKATADASAIAGPVAPADGLEAQTWAVGVVTEPEVTSASTDLVVGDTVFAEEAGPTEHAGYHLRWTGVSLFGDEPIDLAEVRRRLENAAPAIEAGPVPGALPPAATDVGEHGAFGTQETDVVYTPIWLDPASMRALDEFDDTARTTATPETSEPETSESAAFPPGSGVSGPESDATAAVTATLLEDPLRWDAGTPAPEDLVVEVDAVSDDFPNFPDAPSTESPAGDTALAAAPPVAAPPATAAAWPDGAAVLSDVEPSARERRVLARAAHKESAAQAKADAKARKEADKAARRNRQDVATVVAPETSPEPEVVVARRAASKQRKAAEKEMRRQQRAERAMRSRARRLGLPVDDTPTSSRDTDAVERHDRWAREAGNSAFVDDMVDPSQFDLPEALPRRDDV